MLTQSDVVEHVLLHQGRASYRTRALNIVPDVAGKTNCPKNSYSTKLGL